MHKIPIKFEYFVKFYLKLWHNCTLCNLPCKNLICNNCRLWIEKDFLLSETSPKIATYVYPRYHYIHPFKKILHKFKYDNQKSFKWILGYLLYLNLKKIDFNNYDLLIPLPTNINNIKKRNFCHIQEILNYYFLFNQKLPIITNGIYNNSKLSQVGLSKIQRLKNIKNNFEITYNVNNKKILIIDDVITTGATINEFTNLLINHGASKVSACVLFEKINY